MVKFASKFAPVWPFLIALLCGVGLGSVIQTQFNLAQLQALGMDIPGTVRLHTTLHDLAFFAPVYAIELGLSLVVSLGLAHRLALRFGHRTLWSTLGAAVGLLLTIRVVDACVPMPTLIAATRGTVGWLCMALPAALSAALFVRVWPQSQQATPPHKGPQALAGALALPAFGLALLHGALGLSASVLPAAARAQSPAAASVPYQVNTLTEGLQHPWSLAFLPDGRFLVTEREGRLRLIAADGRLQPKPVSGVPAVFASGQAGLFDVLLSPGFAQDSAVYLSYACGTQQANHTCVARAQWTEQGLQGVKEIFRSQLEKSGNAHFGGRMAWLPDQTLVLTLGDGYNYREQAQNLGNHFGKIIRIQADGTTPPDNPFAQRQDAAATIYSFGHRNVQGLVFDPVRKQLIAHEHGARGGDEINLIFPGKNYGWPLATHGIDYNGSKISPYTEYKGTQQPALFWTPSIAPSGMAVVDGPLFPQWRGNLLVGALAAREVHRVSLQGEQAQDSEVLFKELGERIRDVRVGPEGAVYLLTDSPKGRLLKVTPR